MNRNLIGFISILLIGSIAIVGTYFGLPWWQAYQQKASSDAAGARGTLTIGVDNWIGYFPLCGKEMRKRMHDAGYLLKCIDDGADYPGRMKKLRSGELDLAVATVDSFLLNGAKENFPGTVIMVIDESKGGDAIVARAARIASIDDLKNKPSYKIALTPDSPSEHLLKAVSVHFDVPQLRSQQTAWRQDVGGSSEALAQLTTGNVDVAVLWEPDVTKALANKEFVKILGTDNTEKLIVDVLLASHDTNQRKADTIAILLANYFRVLKFYRDNEGNLVDEIRAGVKLSEPQITAMLRGVKWVNLAENARFWFGIGTGMSLASEGLVDTLESAAQILVDAGDFSSSPIPNRDPYRLQHSRFIESLYTQGDAGLFGNMASTETVGSTDSNTLKDLPASVWNKLIEVGTLRIRPINFQSGTAELSQEGKLELDAAAENLKHYPNFRVVVKGHTGLRGDPAANTTLSAQRAASVRKYLMVTHQIAAERLHAVGLGADQPLKRSADESDRAYEYRLPRVELYLVSDAL
ncbi:MAG: OmpA family protein [Gammaproteobacteria bacterium]|nr:OmpA family protein [Gammaproteobacteria bacterium]